MTVFWQFPHSPGKQSPGLFSCPAQILQYPVLTPKPFVLSQGVLVRVGRTGLIRNRLHPPVQGRTFNRQIRRNLTPCRAAGLGDANRILNASLCVAARSGLLDGEYCSQKTGAKPGQVRPWLLGHRYRGQAVRQGGSHAWEPCYVIDMWMVSGNCLNFRQNRIAAAHRLFCEKRRRSMPGCRRATCGCDNFPARIRPGRGFKLPGYRSGQQSEPLPRRRVRIHGAPLCGRIHGAALLHPPRNRHLTRDVGGRKSRLSA